MIVYLDRPEKWVQAMMDCRHVFIDGEYYRITGVGTVRSETFMLLEIEDFAPLAFRIGGFEP